MARRRGRGIRNQFPELRHCEFPVKGLQCLNLLLGWYVKVSTTEDAKE